MYDLISDRDKGLLAADEVLGEGMNRLICCFHLKGNFCKRYSRTLEAYFWPIANAKTVSDYLQHLDTLRQLNSGAAEYLVKIKLSLWVTAHYTSQYFGHKTSNVVKSMNKVLKGNQELSILDLLNEI